MKLLSLILFALVFMAAGFCACWHWQEDIIVSQLRVKPSYVLGFRPVMKGSDETAVMAAQAELCRNQIDCKIDGDCGKQTALGICELLCKLEKIKVKK